MTVQNIPSIGLLSSQLRRCVMAVMTVAMIGGMATGAAAAPVTLTTSYSIDFNRPTVRVNAFDTTLGALQSINLKLNYLIAVENPFANDPSRFGDTCYAQVDGFEISLGTQHFPNVISSATGWNEHTASGRCETSTFNIFKETNSSLDPSKFGDFTSVGPNPGGVPLFIWSWLQLATITAIDPNQLVETYARYNAAVEVSYTYTPVPEPTTAMMLTLGVAGIVARRRTRR